MPQLIKVNLKLKFILPFVKDLFCFDFYQTKVGLFFRKKRISFTVLEQRMYYQYWLSML